MNYYQSPNTSKKSFSSENKLALAVSAVSVLLAGLFFHKSWLLVMIIIVMPVEYSFIKYLCTRLAPKIISFKADQLSAAEALYKTPLVITDFQTLKDSTTTSLVAVETFDQKIQLEGLGQDHNQDLEESIPGKNMLKLLQVAALCTHDDNRLLPPKVDLTALLKISEEELTTQWPTITNWANEGLYFTQHKEVKTHMTQILCMGDLDLVLERCTHILTQGGIDILQKEHVAKLVTDEHRHAKLGDRQWAYAFKISQETTEDPADLIYIGAVAVKCPINNLKDLALTPPYRTVVFTDESPVYAASLAHQINPSARVLDKKTLISHTNKSLQPILDRYTVFSRLTTYDIKRILTLFENKGVSYINASEVSDHANAAYHLGSGFSWRNIPKNMEDSRQLKARFVKAQSFVIMLHLVELIISPILIKQSPGSLLLLNLMVSLLVGLALFLEPVDTEPKPSSATLYVLLVGGFIWLMSPTLAPNVILLFLLFNLLSLSMMLQNSVSLSLRQISFKRTPLYGSIGLLIILSAIFNFSIIQQFIKLFTLGMIPMMIHDIFKLTRHYLRKLKKAF